MSIDNLPDILTIGETARLMRVSKLTVKRMANRGEIPYIRINRRGDRRFKKTDILKILQIPTDLT